MRTKKKLLMGVVIALGFCLLQIRAAESARCECTRTKTQCEITCDDGNATAACGEDRFSGRCEKRRTNTREDCHILFFSLILDLKDVTENKPFDRLVNDAFAQIQKGWKVQAVDNATEPPIRLHVLDCSIDGRRQQLSVGGRIQDLNAYFQRLDRRLIGDVVSGEKEIPGGLSKAEYWKRLDQLITSQFR